MIPVTFLYDEHIDRPKLSEQKNPFEYIVPPPQVGSEQQGEKWARDQSNSFLLCFVK